METKILTWEQIKELIPQSVELYYVDYRDDLDEHLDVVQECIQSNEYQPLSEVCWEWFDNPNMDYYIDELKSDLISKYDLDEEDADTIIQEEYDGIRELLWDRDSSTIEGDLLRNTGRHTMHYDTGYYMDSESWNWAEKRVISEGRQIKKALGLKMSDTTWDEELHMMIRQSSYGGQLVVYFYDAVGDYIYIDESLNTIRFKNAHIAVINTYHGSGDDCFLKGSEFILPLTKANIFIDKTIKYSYTHEVCGMSSDWCQNTKVSFEVKKSKKVIAKSRTHDHLETEAKFNKTYKAGSCTLGDSDINRHRDVSYINDYPCGNKCKDCGQFWID